MKKASCVLRRGGGTAALVVCLLLLSWNVSSTNTTTTTTFRRNSSRFSFPFCHQKFDVLVYGSTPAGILAAVAASRHLVGINNNVALLSQREHIGGMCSGGLGETDVGACADQVIGGFTKEFFLRNAMKYKTVQPRSPWNLEPHVAKRVFLEMLHEAHVTLLPHGQVESVFKNELTGDIEYITVVAADDVDSRMENSTREKRTRPRQNNCRHSYAAKVFIDASYEGDLMARTPNVDYTYGRESRNEYNESGAGSQGQTRMGDFPIGVHINPFLDDNDDDKEDDGSSSSPLLLPYLLRAEQPLPVGHGDKQIQAYNFRLCVTNDDTIRVPFTKPDNYIPDDWELLRRFWLAWRKSTLDTNPYKNEQAMVPTAILGQIPSSSGVKKYDANNCGYNLVHTDMIGGSWAYPEANYSHRETIWDAHVSYTKGFLWFMSSDRSVPLFIRKQYATTWGYCGDEFHDETQNQHFSPQLYVREARRLVGDRVFTQHDAMSKIPRGNESVGMGCYGFDSHCVERYACGDPELCTVYNNTPYVNWQCGCNGIPNPGIYQIPLWVLFPKKHQVRNLLVPVCSSSSHVAFSTLRMEPQLMMLGHAAGVIAALVVQTPGHAAAAVQDVDRNAVVERLLRDGQIIALRDESLSYST